MARAAGTAGRYRNPITICPGTEHCLTRPAMGGSGIAMPMDGRAISVRVLRTMRNASRRGVDAIYYIYIQYLAS